MPLNVKGADVKTRVRLIDEVLQNMSQSYRSLSNTSLLLKGDPGIGKTSFVRQFSALVGLELVLIEVPHIIEEHVINVPFIVTNSDGSKKKDGSLKLPKGESEYKIVLAKSNLAGLLHSAQQTPTPKLLKEIYANENLRILHEKLGGTKERLPEEIEEVRSRYNCVLFIDEYWRETSTNIRNILRGILNGNIGLDKMPEHCFPIYASNMRDTGVEGEIPSNADMGEIEMPTPTKDEWFSWLVNKFKADQDVKLDMRVINTFYDALESKHLSSEDMDTEVRTSPRRWEQLLLFINAALPVKDQEEANHLMANVQATFSNYQTGEKSKLWKNVEAALRKAIEETSGIKAGEATKSTSWRKVLDQQIRMKKKLGSNRAYIPVISGPPGIGKTTMAFKVAQDNDLRYIYVDCSALSADDVIGLPTPEQGAGGKEDLSVGFAKPKLFMMLDKEIKEADAHYKSSPDANPDYENQRWKYLIFFDELNRVKDVKTFNAIRKLLLDKEFNKELKLPESSIVIAAINPDDGSNVLPLTSHMRDVLDILPSDPSWKEYSEIAQKGLKGAAKNETIAASAWRIVDEFSTNFYAKRNNKIPDERRRFYLVVGDRADVYLSPRQYTQLAANILASLESLFKRYKINPQTLEDENYAKEVSEECDHRLISAFKKVLENVFTKYLGGAAPEFFDQLEVWLQGINPVREVISRKNNIGTDFATQASDYFMNHGKSMSDSDHLVNYFNTVSPAEFSEDLLSFLQSKVKTLKDVQDNILTNVAKKKERAEFEMQYLDEQVSLLENFMRDLVHTIKIHNINNEFVETVRHTFKTYLSGLGKNINALTRALDDKNAGRNITMSASKALSTLTKFIKDEMEKV